MALTEENLIKIILGVLVIVAVTVGIYIFFKQYVIDFFKNFSFGKPEEAARAFLALVN